MHRGGSGTGGGVRTLGRSLAPSSTEQALHPRLRPLLVQMNVGGGRPQTHTAKPRGASFTPTTAPLPVLCPCRRPHASPPGSSGPLTAWNRHLEARSGALSKKNKNAGLAGKVHLQPACPPPQLEGPGYPRVGWFLAGPGAAAPCTTSADTESRSPWGGGTVHRRGLQRTARRSAVCTEPLRGTRCSVLCRVISDEERTVSLSNPNRTRPKPLCQALLQDELFLSITNSPAFNTFNQCLCP